MSLCSCWLLAAFSHSSLAFFAGGAWQTVNLLLLMDPPVERGAVDSSERNALHYAIIGGSVRVLEVCFLWGRRCWPDRWQSACGRVAVPGSPHGSACWIGGVRL